MRHIFQTDWEKKIKKAKRVFLFLDFDGTLSPIVKFPSQARITKAAKKALLALSQNPSFIIAIVSGRERKDVASRVGLGSILYFGQHGLEGRFKGRAAYLKTLSGIKKLLLSYQKSCPNLFIEDKKLILALHYRNLTKAEKACWQKLRKKLQQDFQKEHLVNIAQGKKVWEIRPRVDFGKDKVIEKVWRRFKRGPKDLSIYLGDDVTDERAFAKLKQSDLSVHIGYKRSSCALYFLRSPHEAGEFLGHLLILKSE